MRSLWASSGVWSETGERGAYFGEEGVHPSSGGGRGGSVVRKGSRKVVTRPLPGEEQEERGVDR